MVISFSTCQKEEKECIQVKYLIYAVCCNFKFVVIYAFLPPNMHSQNFSVHKKMVFSKSAIPGCISIHFKTTCRSIYGKRYRNYIFGVYLKKDPKLLTVNYMGLLALLSSQNKVPTVSMCTDPNQSNYSREGCCTAPVVLIS